MMTTLTVSAFPLARIPIELTGVELNQVSGGISPAAPTFEFTLSEIVVTKRMEKASPK